MISVSNRVAVMEGALSGLSLADILQVVGIGRQFTGVELRTEDQVPSGTIFVKSGKVVWVDTQGFEGKEAFFRLFHTPSKSFHVFRSSLPEELPEPIGSVPSLLAELNAFEQAARKGLPALMTRARMVKPPTAAHAPENAPVASAVPPSPSLASTSVSVPHRPPLVSPPRPVPVAPSVVEASRDTTEVSPLPKTTVVRQTGESARAVPLPPASTNPVSTRGGADEARVRIVGGDNEPSRPVSQERGGNKRIVAVTGPKGGTGKTTVALNLAVSLARQGVSVALVDGSTNGDIVMATDAGTKRRAGVFDVLAGRASFDDAWTATSLRGLSVMFSLGHKLPEPAVLQGNHGRAWRVLLDQAATRAQVVLVDSPAGMLGLTQQLLAASTHVIGVLQSEVLSQRSMAMFKYSLEALPEEQRPTVLGVLINMVQVRHGTSLDVLKELGEALPASWLFETTLPRNPAFLDASRVGLPLRMVDQEHPPAVSWLFDALAAEVIERLALVSADAPRTALRFLA